MAHRTQQEVNDLGFEALVRALGKEDALRFIRGFSGVRFGSRDIDEEDGVDEPLPPMTPDQIHEKIMDMREPNDQASFL